MRALLADAGTVMWKEWRELSPATKGRGRAWNLLTMLAVFGVFLPLQSGRAWVESPLTLAYWAWVPLFLVTGVIADSFAGERERHTLETLLASRLPDTAILLGKTLAAVAYAWGVAAVSLLAGLVTVNVATWNGQLALYSPVLAGAGLLLGLLTASVAAGAGVLVSLRAGSARQAAQTMSIAIMLLLFVPVFGFQALPAAWKAGLATALQGVDERTALLVAVLALLALNAVLYAAARLRFQRARLILE